MLGRYTRFSGFDKMVLCRLMLNTVIAKLRGLQGQIGCRNLSLLIGLVVSFFVLGSFAAEANTTGSSNVQRKGIPLYIRILGAIYIRVLDLHDYILNFYEDMRCCYRIGLPAFWWYAGFVCFCLVWILFLVGAHYRVFFKPLLAGGLGQMSESSQGLVLSGQTLAPYVRLVSFFNDKWHIDAVANSASTAVLQQSARLKTDVEPLLFLSLFGWPIKFVFYVFVYFTSLFVFFIFAIFQFLILVGYLRAVQVLLEYAIDPLWRAYYYRHAELLYTPEPWSTPFEVKQLEQNVEDAASALNAWYLVLVPDFCCLFAAIALLIMIWGRLVIFFAFKDARLEDCSGNFYRRILMLASIPERLYCQAFARFLRLLLLFQKCEQYYYSWGLRVLSHLRIGSLSLRGVMLLSFLMLFALCFFILF